MEEFLANVPIKRILAGILVLALIFSGFYKEDFLMNKSEKDAIENLGNLSKNRLSGKTVLAIIYLTITLISLAIGLLIYN